MWLDTKTFWGICIGLTEHLKSNCHFLVQKHVRLSGSTRVVDFPWRTWTHHCIQTSVVMLPTHTGFLHTTSTFYISRFGSEQDLPIAKYVYGAASHYLVCLGEHGGCTQWVQDWMGECRWGSRLRHLPLPGDYTTRSVFYAPQCKFRWLKIFIIHFITNCNCILPVDSCILSSIYSIFRSNFK